MTFAQTTNKENNSYTCQSSLFSDRSLTPFNTVTLTKRVSSL